MKAKIKRTDKFIGDENSVTAPICNDCKHHLGGAECRAFKNIPRDILSGGKHNRIIPGQKGKFIFEKVNDSD